VDVHGLPDFIAASSRLAERRLHQVELPGAPDLPVRTDIAETRSSRSLWKHTAFKALGKSLAVTIEEAA
jgi:hypothetical protein